MGAQLLKIFDFEILRFSILKCPILKMFEFGNLSKMFDFEIFHFPPKNFKMYFLRDKKIFFDRDFFYVKVWIVSFDYAGSHPHYSPYSPIIRIPRIRSQRISKDFGRKS